MSTTTSSRLGLSRWSAGTDAWPARPGWDAENATLDNLVAIDLQVATLADRPAASIRGRYCEVEDDGTGVTRLYRDNGTAWREIGPVGGGGAGGTLKTDGSAGAEGTSVKAARADHTHRLPIVLLESGTSAPPAGTPVGAIIFRKV